MMFLTRNESSCREQCHGPVPRGIEITGGVINNIIPLQHKYVKPELSKSFQASCATC